MIRTHRIAADIVSILDLSGIRKTRYSSVRLLSADTYQLYSQLAYRRLYYIGT